MPRLRDTLFEHTRQNSLHVVEETIQILVPMKDGVVYPLTVFSVTREQNSNIISGS